MLKTSTEEIIRLYEEHKSSYKVAGIVGCHPTTARDRLKKAGKKLRHSGGIRGELKYPMDKAKAAAREGFSSWDEALVALNDNGYCPAKIAAKLGEATGANIRQRLRYLKEIKNVRD
jgi:hypothetical protein